MGVFFKFKGLFVKLSCTVSVCMTLLVLSGLLQNKACMHRLRLVCKHVLQVTLQYVRSCVLCQVHMMQLVISMHDVKTYWRMDASIVTLHTDRNHMTLDIKNQAAIP